MTWGEVTGNKMMHPPGSELLRGPSLHVGPPRTVNPPLSPGGDVASYRKHSNPRATAEAMCGNNREGLEGVDGGCINIFCPREKVTMTRQGEESLRKTDKATVTHPRSEWAWG